MDGLTQKQQNVLSTIEKFSQANGFMPTQRELGALLGIKQNAVRCHLVALERKGFMKSREGLPRHIRLMKTVPICDTNEREVARLRSAIFLAVMDLVNVRAIERVRAELAATIGVKLCG